LIVIHDEQQVVNLVILMMVSLKQVFRPNPIPIVYFFSTLFLSSYDRY